MSDTKQPDGEPLRASEDELQIAFSGPAVISNKIYVTGTTAGVRIAFTEQRLPTSTPIFRTAVMLPYPDAMALVRLLHHIIKDVQFEIQRNGIPVEPPSEG